MSFSLRTPLAIVLLLTPQICCGAVPRLFREKAFTAASLAEAINHFVELGEQAAVQELRALTAHKDEFNSGFRINERVGWMCRVLFEPKGEKPIPQPAFGGLNLPWASMPLERWPLFPIARSGSTYFVLAEGYLVLGVPEDPKHYIDVCRKLGTFRKNKVIVPARAQALKDAVALRKSKAWLEIKWHDSTSSGTYRIDERSVWEFITKQAESIDETKSTKKTYDRQW